MTGITTQAASAIPLAAVIDCYRGSPDTLMTPHKWAAWAYDCAERTLHTFERQYPDDARPRRALEAARAWLTDPTEKSVGYDAAGNAAADAAADAAGNAARAAAYAAYAAADAAYAAAYAAADAARDAAYAAADAARDAAYAAARGAADAADAAYAADAARYTAYAAAYDATRAAEEQWQAIRLVDIYHGDKEQAA